MLQSALNISVSPFGVIRSSTALLRVLAALDCRTCAQHWLGLLHAAPSQHQQPRGFTWPARTMSSAADPLHDEEHAEASAAAPTATAPVATTAVAAAVAPAISEVAELHRVAPLQLPSGVKKTFYKRKLPCPPATEFSSAEGRLLFGEALAAGTMTGFFKLVEQYSTQDEPAFCGLSSVAMVLNALSIDPKRPWKGSWRWFHETLLDCCLPLDTVAQEGVVLTQAACLAKCNGARVSLHRAGTFTLEEFRQQVLDVASSGEEHLIVSYSRKAFQQTGDGHFSPVGGYHGGRDLVLILDTARFKYPPHWVPLPMLYEAMAAVDPTTGLPRGFLRLAADTRPDSVLFTLDIRSDGWWRDAERYITQQAPLVLQSLLRGGAASLQQLVCGLVAAAPLSSVSGFIAVRLAAHQCAKDRCVPHAVRHQVLAELRATPLYQLVQRALPPDYQPIPTSPVEFLPEKLAMLLLLREPSSWAAEAAWPDGGELHKQWQQLLDASGVSIVDSEVRYLREQLQHLDEVLAESGKEPGSACSSCEFQDECALHKCMVHSDSGNKGSSSSGVILQQAIGKEQLPREKLGSCGGCCS